MKLMQTNYFRNANIFDEKCSDLFFEIGEIFQIYRFSRRFFNGFQKKMMFWKEETPLIKLSLISIYERCRQVGVQRRKRKTFFSTRQRRTRDV